MGLSSKPRSPATRPHVLSKEPLHIVYVTSGISFLDNKESNNSNGINDWDEMIFCHETLVAAKREHALTFRRRTHSVKKYQAVLFSPFLGSFFSDNIGGETSTKTRFSSTSAKELTALFHFTCLGLWSNLLGEG